MTVNKKKYNVSWSIFNIGSANNEIVVNLQHASDAFFGALTGSTFVAGNAEWALAAGALGMIVSKLVVGCLDVEQAIENEIKNGSNTSPTA